MARDLRAPRSTGGLYADRLSVNVELPTPEDPVDLIRARALAEELVLARPYSWKRQGDAWRGTLDAGGFVSVRLDDRKRITFVRTDAPGRPHALDLRYDGKSGWVHEMDVHDEGLEIGMRWTRRDAGLFDLDLAATTGEAGGSIHVRVLEIAKP